MQRQRRPDEELSQSSPELPLQGVRVLDLSTSATSSMVTNVLADFGADVLQVEPPGGSSVRQQRAYPFWARGKRSIELDLADPAGQAAARSHAEGCDVVVETFRPGVAERMGVGYDDLRSGNPGLVYASVTGFGRVGPYASVKGYEGIVAARLGLAGELGPMSGRPGPAYPSVAYCTVSAAQTAVHGVLASLLERERSGLGQRVDATLVQGLAAHDTWNWFSEMMVERYPGSFNLQPTSADVDIPNGPLRFQLLVALTADGRWLQFSQTSPRLFLALMRALGLEWMFEDPMWSTAPVFDDIPTRIAFWEHMLRAARTKTLAEWQAMFDETENLWAELYRVDSELLDHPQLLHDGFVADIEDHERGMVRQSGPIARLSRTPARIGTSAPRLGQGGSDGWATREPVPAPSAAAASSSSPLAGITVVEFGGFYAGPYAAAILAELGARVIKVEPHEGDPMRQLAGFPEIGAIKVLQGKESVVVDLSTEASRVIVDRLLAQADVVLQTFRASAAERLGIGAASILERFPDIVYVTAVGYGADGPCAHRPAFAPTIGAASGIGWRNLGPSIPERADLTLEEEKRYALRLAKSVGVAQPDGFGALGAATAVLLGLLARGKGRGGGQTVVATMLNTTAHALADTTVSYANCPVAPVTGPELLGPLATYRFYETAEGWVFLAALDDQEWADLVVAMADHVDLTDAREDEALAEMLATAFRARPAAEWERHLLAHDVACVVASERSPEGELQDDSFGRASGFVTDVEHPTFGVHPRLSSLVRFSRSPTVMAPGCLLGEHTDAVLGELGFSDEEVAKLRADGVVA